MQQTQLSRSDQDYGTSWKEYSDMENSETENVQEEPIEETSPEESVIKRADEILSQKDNTSNNISIPVTIPKTKKGENMSQSEQVKLNNNMYEKELPNFDNLEVDYPEATVLEGNMSIQNMEVPGLLIVKPNANVKVKNNLKCNTLWLSGSLHGYIEAENICLFSEYALLEGVVKTKHLSYECPDGENYNTFTAQILMKNKPN